MEHDNFDISAVVQALGWKPTSSEKMNYTSEQRAHFL